LETLRFFRRLQYLEERVAPRSPESQDNWRTLTDAEAMALQEAGAEDLIWRLAMRAGLPFNGINDVLATPAPVLFQAEIIADAKDRIDKRQAEHDSIQAALAKANRGPRG